MMMPRPTTPSTIFWGLGALTIGSKIAGSGMSALEAAGDLEGHQARGLAEIAPGDDDVDLLELAGAPEVLHEVGDRRGRERRAAHLEPEVLARLEPRDPQVLRDHAGEDVDLTDRHLELGELSLALGDRAREVPLLQGERPPVGHGPDDRDHVHDGEKRAEVEARERERRKADAPPSLRLGRQIDPDHLPLSPGRLSPSPTATASAGPAALTSSP